MMEAGRIPKQALCAALLAALALAATTYPVDASVGRSHAHVLTPEAVYKICSHGRSPAGASRGTVAVRGYYLTLPSFVSFVELGVLVDREMSASQAYQFAIVPARGNPDEHVPKIKIAKAALVVQGPSQGPVPPGSPLPQRLIPSQAWVIVQARLFCRHLDDNNAVFTNGRGKPFLGEKSWRLWQKQTPPTAAPERTCPAGSHFARLRTRQAVRFVGSSQPGWYPTRWVAPLGRSLWSQLPTQRYTLAEKRAHHRHGRQRARRSAKGARRQRGSEVRNPPAHP